MKRLVRLNEIQYVESDYQAQKLIAEGFTVDETYEKQKRKSPKEDRKDKPTKVDGKSEAGSKADPKGE